MRFLFGLDLNLYADVEFFFWNFDFWVELKGQRSRENERKNEQQPRPCQSAHKHAQTRAQTRPSERMTGSYAQLKGNTRAIKNDANHSLLVPQCYR